MNENNPPKSSCVQGIVREVKYIDGLQYAKKHTISNESPVLAIK